MAITTKGFIKDWQGNKILPITRGELVLDKDGNVALTSQHFLAGENGNQYGLITAAERAMLNGGQNGNSLTDVYAKLGQINGGLTFNNIPLSFYSASGATPINITADTAKGITLGIADNTVTLGLTELTTSEISVQQLIRSITVDKYGRVTSVSGSALTDSDIPSTLTGKTLTNCTTAVVGEAGESLVNKAYVDAKIASANGIATGALKFGGVLTQDSNLTEILASSDNTYKYYKVAYQGLKVSVDSLYDTAGIPTAGSPELVLKPGDTLIVYPASIGTGNRFVYIPSADDYSITVSGKSSEGVDSTVSNRVNHMSITFASPFTVSTAENGVASVSMSQVSESKDGYLSAADYTAFKKYADDLVVIYNGKFTSGTGVYEIGTITIGGTEHTIYGKNNISALELVNGETDEYNPVLRFTENGVNTDLTIKGSKGIAVRKSGNNIEIASLISVSSDSESYLSISDDNKFGVKLGSINEDGTYNEGLVNFSTVHSLATQVGKTTVYEEINYTLIGTDSSKYQYGNEKLKAAITLTI